MRLVNLIIAKPKQTMPIWLFPALAILLSLDVQVTAQSPNTRANSQNYSPSPEQRQSDYLKHVDDMSSQVDPALIQMMKEVYQKGASSNFSVPETVNDFTRQEQHSTVTTTSSPPAGFPAPLYRGTNSQYSVQSPTQLSNAGASTTIHTVKIATSDSASTVSSWYKTALAQSGWKVIDPYAAAAQLSRNSKAARYLPGGVVPQMRRLTSYPSIAAKAGIRADEQIAADKNELRASIQIVEYAKRTEVSVSVIKQ